MASEMTPVNPVRIQGKGAAPGTIVRESPLTFKFLVAMHRSPLLKLAPYPSVPHGYEVGLKLSGRAPARQVGQPQIARSSAGDPACVHRGRVSSHQGTVCHPAESDVEANSQSLYQACASAY